MRMGLCRTIVALLFIGGVVTALAAGKVVPRVVGLESNKEYMSLLEREQALRIGEDSVAGLVEKIRRSFRDNTGSRATAGAEIIRLEGELYDIRNEIGVMESKINAIEQEFVINNLDSYMKVSDSTPTAAVPQSKPLKISANLIANTYFKENLVDKEYNALTWAQSKEVSVVNYLKIYTNNYDQIKSIEERYEAVNNARSADSLYSKYKLLEALNEKIADSISAIWANVYDNKSYAYSYLFDKMNRSDILTDYEESAMKVRQQSAEIHGKYSSDAVATYLLYKKLLLDYEIKIASVLKLNMAADSLKTVLAKVGAQNFQLPKINITERTFIDYKRISISTRSPYSSAKPIPKCTIYPRGVVYRILLGSYTKAQLPSIFRGVSPIGYIHANDKYNYYAGAYESEQLAEAGVEQLRKAGFKNPMVVVWENGEMTNLATGEKSADGATTTVSGKLFRIEINSDVSDLSQAIKQIITNAAEGIDISRIANSSENEFVYTFIIATFDSQTAAQRLAEAISAQESDLKVNVVEINN